MIDAIANVFGKIIARFIDAISSLASKIASTIDPAQYSALQVAIDIILVAILFYWLILLIRGTRATNIVIGLFILVLIFGVSRWLNLLALGWLLDRLLTVVLIAIPIIFQQELRRGLEKLGRTKFFDFQTPSIDKRVHAITAATFEISNKKNGALMVLAGKDSLAEYAETGVKLHAEISDELIRTLFMPTSPLHDGAIIIDGDRIVAAACILPNSVRDHGHEFGTRHKAALGISEVSDAKVIVVSEQRGSVSYVADGKMEKDIDADRLQALLSALYKPRHGKKYSS